MSNFRDKLDEVYKRPEGLYARIRRAFAEELKKSDVGAQGSANWEDVVGNNYVVDVQKRTNEMADRIFRMTKRKYDERQQEGKEKVEARNDKVTCFSRWYVLEVLTRCFASVDPADWCVSLQLASGARYCEIISSSVSQWTHSSDEFVVQTGIAKDKSGNSTPLDKQLIGITGDQFLGKLKTLREWVQSNGDCKGRTKRHTSLFFPLLGGKGGTHTNRAIRAAVARYDSERRRSPCLAVMKMLGHKTMATAPHYMHVTVTDRDCDDIGGMFQHYQSPKGSLLLIRPVRRHEFQEQFFKECQEVVDELKRAEIKCSRQELARLGLTERTLRMLKERTKLL